MESYRLSICNLLLSWAIIQVEPFPSQDFECLQLAPYLLSLIENIISRKIVAHFRPEEKSWNFNPNQFDLKCNFFWQMSELPILPIRGRYQNRTTLSWHINISTRKEAILLGASDASMGKIHRSHSSFFILIFLDLNWVIWELNMQLKIQYEQITRQFQRITIFGMH